MKQMAMPVFHAKIDDLFAQVFMNREIVAEWIRFAGTGGGGKFLDFLRQGVVANARHLPAPTDAELDADLAARSAELLMAAPTACSPVVMPSTSSRS